jgi:uncharacterized protein involved in exopolysaccharide biosynthesis
MQNKKQMAQNAPNKRLKYLIFVGGFILGLMVGKIFILKYYNLQ